MNKNSLAIVVFILAVALSGCAVTPQSRFAEFYERPSHPENIDVVIDTLILSDISGSDVGIDRVKNAEAMALIEHAVKQSFAKRGFTANVAFHGNGITFKPEGGNYVYATNWTSTGETYSGPVYHEQDQMWQSAEVQTFLHRLLDHAKYANKHVSKNKKSNNPRVLVPPLTPDEIPASIMSMPSDLFVLVNLSGAEIGMGKSIGTAVATGLLSAALTGGMYVASSTTTSGTHLEVIVFDKSQSRVVWHNVGQGPKYTQLSKGVDTVMNPFPTVTGERYSPNRKKSKN